MSGSRRFGMRRFGSQFLSEPDWAPPVEKKPKRKRGPSGCQRDKLTPGEYMSRAVCSARERARWYRAEHEDFTAADMWAKLEAQGHRCYYCGGDIRDAWQIEHMTPLSAGGGNTLANIVMACEPCNRSKFTKTAEEFTPILFDGDQLTFLRPGG